MTLICSCLLAVLLAYHICMVLFFSYGGSLSTILERIGVWNVGV